jgi:hypothetical protein
MSLRRYFRNVSRPEVRRRLAPLVLVTGALVTWLATRDDLPQSQAVCVILPQNVRADARRVRLLITRDGEGLGGVERLYQAGAPSEVNHSMALARGQYGLYVAVTDADGAVRESQHLLDVPTEGAARFRPFEGSP